MSLIPAGEQEGILNALGFNPRDPKVQALALVAQRYGLDLILKQVFLIQGTVYVSHAGLLSVAHRSGDLDGLEVEVTEEPTKWVATAKVYRKSMSRPFVYTDECFKNEQKVVDKRKRAITRAERNALRRAFDVGVDVYEDDRPEPPITLSDNKPALGGGGPRDSSSGLAAPRALPEPSPPSHSTLDAQRSVVVRCREMGLDDHERHSLVWFATNGRTRSSKEITEKEAGEIHRWLHHLKSTGEKPWSASRPSTSTFASPPSTSSPAGTTTSSEETPSGDAAEDAKPLST